MRSEHSTWRPLFRTTERSWPLKTSLRRSSPPRLPIQRAEQVRQKQNRPLVHLIAASFVSPFFISFLTSLATLVSPPSQHTCLPPYPSPSLFFNAYARWWISNDKAWLFMRPDWLQTHGFLHFLKPHSRYFVHPFSFFKLHLSVQLLPHEYKQPLKCQLQSACLCLRLCVCVSSWAQSLTLKRSDRQTAARGCQHSPLISPWWIEWKTCLILFFLLVAALIDLQQHWNQYKIALFYSIGSQHTFCFDKESTSQYHTSDALSFSDMSGLIRINCALACMQCVYCVWTSEN